VGDDKPRLSLLGRCPTWVIDEKGLIIEKESERFRGLRVQLLGAACAAAAEPDLAALFALTKYPHAPKP
jgi:hypothetical protein